MPPHPRPLSPGYRGEGGRTAPSPRGSGPGARTDTTRNRPRSRKGPVMFGALFFERDPLSLRDLPELLRDWIQSLGGVSALALFVWVVLWECGFFRRATAHAPAWLAGFFRLGLLVTLV